MDEEGSAGSQHHTKKTKEEDVSLKEITIKEISKADDTSIQSQEEIVSLISLTDRGRFQTSEHRRQAVKEQLSRLKAKKIEEDFYKWDKEFLEFCEFLGIKNYIIGDKQYPSTQEILCDTLVDGDQNKFVEVIL